MTTKLLGTIIICAITFNMDAQQDSSKIKKTEPFELSKLSTSYFRLNTNQSQKSLFKFNLLGTLFNGINISYERKIAPKWSLNINSVTNIYSPGQNAQFFYGVGFASKDLGAFDFYQSLSFELRYYCNLERRARLGKKTDFSGNYFGLVQNNSYNNNSTFSPFYGTNFFYSLGLIYGVQRRIGRIGYIDGSIGIEIRHYPATKQTSISPITKIAVGIAF